MTTAAAQKRYDAIRALTEFALDCNNGHQVAEGMSVGKLLKRIKDMKKLGRTNRWHAALTRWEDMILECDDYVKDTEEWKRHLHWAVLQGNVYTGYAAE